MPSTYAAAREALFDELQQIIPKVLECQSAFNRDPLSARKRDPVSVA